MQGRKITNLFSGHAPTGQPYRYRIPPCQKHDAVYFMFVFQMLVKLTLFEGNRKIE
jgi:hypothetical protein